MVAAATYIFELTQSQGYSLEYARTAAVNIFVFIELFYLFNCKDLEKSVFKTDILNNKRLLIGVFLMGLAQILFTHTEPMNRAFKSQGLDLSTWLLILLISFGVIFIIELKLLVTNRIFNRRSS